ncbi:MAG: hypothetical protein LBH99_04460 [Rickettsia sp.]|jgi:hypothetical protein|nr:hypothetical protein [Rickettsia sp.]
MQLELNPTRTAKSLLDDLIKGYPNQFNINHIRTLQRRVAEWRKEQIAINQKQRYQNTITEDNAINMFHFLPILL